MKLRLAKERQKTLNNAGGKLSTSDKGKARDKAAAAIGLSGKTAEKLEAIVKAADAGDTAAVDALAEIDRKKGIGIDSAYRNVVQPAPSAPLAPVVNAWDVLVKDDRPERTGYVGRLVAKFNDSDLRGALGTTTVSDPVPTTDNRFNLTVYADADVLKKIRGVIGAAPAVKFIGLTATQVELVAAALSPDKPKTDAAAPTQIPADCPPCPECGTTCESRSKMKKHFHSAHQGKAAELFAQWAGKPQLAEAVS